MRRWLLVLLLVGCSGEDPGPLVSRVCNEGGRTYEPGKSWPCSDGCNTCACNNDGTVSTTLIACTEAGVDSGTETSVDSGAETSVDAAPDTNVDAASDGG